MDSNFYELFVLFFTGMTIVLQFVIWGVTMVISVGTLVFSAICRYKIFKKAGYEGWEAIIPFYNHYIMAEITLGSGWWFLIMLIPCVGNVIAYVMNYRLGMAFQKDVGFKIGLIFVPIVFLAILAFSKDNTYRKLQPI